jgi:ribosomal protein S27E
MATIAKLEKIEEGRYHATSLPCPMCGDSLTIEMPTSNLFAYNNGASITEVFPTLAPAERERFISGTCGDCWNKMFAFDDDEEGDDD